MKNDAPEIVQIDIDRTSLYAPAPGAEKERASLTWQLVNMGTGYGFNPRITVWTRSPNDLKKPIDAPLNAHSAEMLLELIEMACAAEPGYRAPALTCEAPLKDENTGERMRGNRIISRVIVGKDKEGRVRMAVISEDESRPQITFTFDTGMMHHLLHKDGSPVTEAEASVMAARATVRVLRNAFAKYPPIITVEDRAVQKSFRENMNSGRGNRPNRPQPQSRTADFEDISL